MMHNEICQMLCLWLSLTC